MTPAELIERYKDAMEGVIGERPNIQHRFGTFYRIDRERHTPIQRSTLERVVSAWGRE